MLPLEKAIDEDIEDGANPQNIRKENGINSENINASTTAKISVGTNKGKIIVYNMLIIGEMVHQSL